MNPIAGATTSSYTSPALTVTTSYWVQVSNGAGPTNSNTATITLNLPKHDFNHDGKADILLRDGAGGVYLWMMDGYTVTNRFIASIWNGWAIVGTGDFNGDGKADILWKDSAGNMAIWLMDGSVVSSYSSIGNIPMSSTVSGVADFNGDSRTDILWRDTDGNVFMWVMDGYTVTNRFIASIWNGWAIIGAEDFNGDGKADILWKDSAGNMAIWLMDGPVISSFAAVGNLADRTPQ
jgi:Tol biopolymer transport system component